MSALGEVNQDLLLSYQSLKRHWFDELLSELWLAGPGLKVKPANHLAKAIVPLAKKP